MRDDLELASSLLERSGGSGRDLNLENPTPAGVAKALEALAGQFGGGSVNYCSSGDTADTPYPEVLLQLANQDGHAIPHGGPVDDLRGEFILCVLGALWTGAFFYGWFFGR